MVNANSISIDVAQSAWESSEYEMRSSIGDTSEKENVWYAIGKHNPASDAVISLARYISLIVGETN